MIKRLIKFIKEIFKTKYTRDISKLKSIINLINCKHSIIKNVNNDQLRKMTFNFKKKINDHLIEINNDIKNTQIILKSYDINSKEQKIYIEKLKKLYKKRQNKIKFILNDLLPEAFAVIKETCLRFKNKNSLKVQCSEYDKIIAINNDYVNIKDQYALWNTKWNIDNIITKWHMSYYDEQLMGAVVLHQGKIAEMSTGEGKTLVSVCAAYLNALSNYSVHIITVNDYLAKRDYQWMKPIFEFHGISVSCIDKHLPGSKERVLAYNANIIYGTNKEFGFDYLRNNMSNDIKTVMSNDFNYAIIDEVDSVLIDEARTPLVISGPYKEDNNINLNILKPYINKLYDIQKKYIDSILIQAKEFISQNDYDNGGFLLLRIYRGMPNDKNFINYLSKAKVKNILKNTENNYLKNQQKYMYKIDLELYFVIDEKNNSVELTDKGINFIKSNINDNFFILPDINNKLNYINSQSISDDKKKQKIKNIINEYALKSKKIHYLNQLLKAYTLFQINKDYIIQNDKIKIIDVQTGRIAEGKRYSDGIHQAIEAKENVTIEESNQILATITLQNYFRMYNKISGMTGTALTDADEFWEIYNLDIIKIPTHLPVIRHDYQDYIFKTKKAKYKFIVNKIIELHDKGIPILVGTTSIENSELMSQLLYKNNINHNILNAKNYYKEANIIQEAGLKNSVTIATNMAGRGTDIKISNDVCSIGGLFVIGTERHESRRIDNQLRGRSGRQGNPGASQFFISLQDDLMRLFGSDKIYNIMDKMGYKDDDIIKHSLITKSIERAQKKIEESNFEIRKKLIEYDNIIDYQRKILYSMRYNSLFKEKINIEIFNIINIIINKICFLHKKNNNFFNLKNDFLHTFALNIKLTKKDFLEKSLDKITFILLNEVKVLYQYLESKIENSFIFFSKKYNYNNFVVNYSNNINNFFIKVKDYKNTDIIFLFKKTLMLDVIDTNWKKHLKLIHELKQSVQNAVYEQKDPLLIYKFESFQLFQNTINQINKDFINFYFTSNISLKIIRTHLDNPLPNNNTKLLHKKIKRNILCPCGSNKKYKYCHGI